MTDQNKLSTALDEYTLKTAQEHLRLAQDKLEAYQIYVNQLGVMIDRVEPEHSLIDVRHELCSYSDGLTLDELRAARMMYRTHFEVGADCIQYALDHDQDEILSGDYLDSIHYYADMMSGLSRLERFTSVLDRLIDGSGPEYMDPVDYVLFKHDMLAAAHDQIDVWCDEDNLGSDFDASLAYRCESVMVWFETHQA